ncbi:MAG: ferritin-like domain-containing protein [Deltaproteobacteria bacterium]|nr:MAG: ferritin-like domain-containing protein [Deltaproteobacteria bacterium]
MSLLRVHREWGNRVAAEYRSAAITARVLHGCIAVGMARELVEVARRIVGDELDHAELCAQCLADLGGGDAPPPLEFAQLAGTRSEDGFVADLVDEVLRSFCLGETFAVPLFAEMRKGTTHPAAEPVLTRVLRDEAIHRQFGWDALDALLELDDEGVRSRAARGLPAMIEGYYRAYGAHADGPSISAEERSMGLMDGATYAAVYEETLTRTIRPWFARRGIEVPA